MDRTLVLLIGVLAVATGVIAWSMERSHFSPSEKPFSSGFTKHVLAIELVRTNSDVQEIVGELGDPNREVMRGKVQKDFFFIPAYALLFAALGWLLGRSNYRFAIWVGAAIVACAAGAAVFDVIENLRIFGVLDARLADATQAMVDSLRSASLVKWAFVFISIALLSPIVFLRRELFTLPIGPPRLAAVFGVIIALAYLLAGFIGLIGLKQDPLIEKASTFMSLALLLTVLLLLIAFFARGRRGEHVS
jgi:hypothetical protein